jgi:uncharacterized protein
MMMVRSEDMRIAELLKERLKAEGVPLIDLRIYGSRARGEATDESDLDTFLILKRIDSTIEETINRIAWEVGFQAGIVITTADYTPYMIECTPLRESPFIRAVMLEGVPV